MFVSWKYKYTWSYNDWKTIKCGTLSLVVLSLLTTLACGRVASNKSSRDNAATAASQVSGDETEILDQQDEFQDPLSYFPYSLDYVSPLEEIPNESLPKHTPATPRIEINKTLDSIALPLSGQLKTQFYSLTIRRKNSRKTPIYGPEVPANIEVIFQLQLDANSKQKTQIKFIWEHNSSNLGPKDNQQQPIFIASLPATATIASSASAKKYLPKSTKEKSKGLNKLTILNSRSKIKTKNENPSNSHSKDVVPTGTATKYKLHIRCLDKPCLEMVIVLKKVPPSTQSTLFAIYRQVLVPESTFLLKGRGFNLEEAKYEELNSNLSLLYQIYKSQKASHLTFRQENLFILAPTSAISSKRNKNEEFFIVHSNLHIDLGNSAKNPAGLAKIEVYIHHIDTTKYAYKYTKNREIFYLDSHKKYIPNQLEARLIGSNLDEKNLTIEFALPKQEQEHSNDSSDSHADIESRSDYLYKGLQLHFNGAASTEESLHKIDRFKVPARKKKLSKTRPRGKDGNESESERNSRAANINAQREVFNPDSSKLDAQGKPLPSENSKNGAYVKPVDQNNEPPESETEQLNSEDSYTAPPDVTSSPLSPSAVATAEADSLDPESLLYPWSNLDNRSDLNEMTKLLDVYRKSKYPAVRNLFNFFINAWTSPGITRNKKTIPNPPKFKGFKFCGFKNTNYSQLANLNLTVDSPAHYNLRKQINREDAEIFLRQFKPLIPFVAVIFESKDMLIDFSLVPAIEATKELISYDTRVVNMTPPYFAGGIYQFTRKTSRDEMNVNVLPDKFPTFTHLALDDSTFRLDPRDARTNFIASAYGAASYLRHLINRNRLEHDPVLSIVSYSSGIGNVTKWRKHVAAVNAKEAETVKAHSKLELQIDPLSPTRKFDVTLADLLHRKNGRIACEAIRYVFAWLAITEISANPTRYGFEPTTTEFEQFLLPNSMRESWLQTPDYLMDEGFAPFCDTHFPCRR